MTTINIKKSGVPREQGLTAQMHTFNPLTSQEGKTSEVVLKQLKKLIQICDRISNCRSNSDDLLNLSLGVGCIPKEKKFSQKWSGVLPENQWLLLEDISRQLSKGSLQNPQRVVQQFSDSAKTLKVVFETLRDIELDLPPRFDKPSFILPQTETLFYPQFDSYLLDQINRRIQIIKASFPAGDFVVWLKADRIHVKALFRAIEVIGEASKIISAKAKEQLPFLKISHNKKPLWVRLRNQLHHNKGRSWDIAWYAPDRWKELWGLILSVEEEITQYKDSNPPPSEPKDADIDFMRELVRLCEEEKFREVRPLWRKMQADFKSDPTELARILFGFENVEEDQFSNMWERRAKPHLKMEANEDENKRVVFEILRIIKGNLIRCSDIEKLSTSMRNLDKKTVVEKMKRLLQAVQSDETLKNIIEEYERWADQLVFLKNGQTDNSKNEELKKLISKRLKQIVPTEFNLERFKNPDGSLAPYGELLELYIRLKSYDVNLKIKTMREQLQRIRSTWPDVELTEENIERFGLGAKTDDPKTIFNNNLKKLQGEGKFIGLLPDEEPNNLAKELKIFPASRIYAHFKKKRQVCDAKLVKEINDSKEQCLKAVDNLNCFLDAVNCDESLIRKSIWTCLEEAVECFRIALQTIGHNPDEFKKNREKVEGFFADCAFKSTSKKDIPKLIEALNKAMIDHSFKEASVLPDLNSLRLQVQLALQALEEGDLQAEVDALVAAAEEVLSEKYVQTVLYNSVKKLPSLNQLRNIHRSGLSPEDFHSMSAAWDAIERKAAGKRLSSEKKKEVLDLFPPDDVLNEGQEKVKKELIEYMDGIKTEDIKALELQSFSRFEHDQKKLGAFEMFLENKCFCRFPQFRIHKPSLLSYFKIAYSIIDVQNKAIHFSNRFRMEAEKIGNLYSEIFKPKEEQPSHRKLLLQAAGYDMQSMGEMAQLITERPQWWHLGQHILSSQHLSSMSLMRKMMAHYPLQLSSSSMRWNLEYLAFDASHTLSQNSSVVFLEPIQAPKRKLMTGVELRERVFEIKDYLDRLHLSVNADIIYPSLSTLKNAYLHPFGDLGLLVYPIQRQEKTEFTYAVMELELILSYELDAKVSVVGQWQEGEWVNIPSKKHLPSDYLKKMTDTKQSMDDWITSNHAYEIFKKHPWSYVIYKSGEKVSRGDHELYRDLVFFFQMLDFHRDQEALRNFLEMPESHLLRHIYSCLEKLHKSQVPYSKSQLFRFICCLFERFSPPGARPDYPIRLPLKYGDNRPLTTMIDVKGYGLGRLPEKIHGPAEYIEIYYHPTGERLDHLNGRSLLDPLVPVKSSELKFLADYTVGVLQAHVAYILKKFHSNNRLDRAQFLQIERVVICDPVLAGNRDALNEVPPDVTERIRQESIELVEKITALISCSVKDHGLNYTKCMLTWMDIDKKIEQTALEYYDKNRLSLKKSYIELDEKSRVFFDENYIQKNLNIPFPVVSSFRNFINRLNRETSSIEIDPNNGQILGGDFSEVFKALGVESNMQEILLSLIKQRQGIMWEVQDAFLQRHSYTSEASMDLINDIYLKWDKLFRMVQSPKVFSLLYSHVQTRRDITAKANKQSLQEALQQDFEEQYKTSITTRESSGAKSATREIHLYEARGYFDGKCKTARVQQNYNQFEQALHRCNLWERFECDWKEIYGSEYRPQYYEDIFLEAQEVIDGLLVRKQLPDHNFDPVPSYGEYWDFVNHHPTSMTSGWMTSGVKISFKQLLINQTSYSQFIQDTKIKRALQTDKRLEKLVEAYMSFFHLENEMSDWSYYMKHQTERYEELKQRKAEAEQLGKERWMLDEYQRRLEYTGLRLKTACERFNATLERAKETDFFKLMKFSAKWQSVLEHGKLLAEAENQERAMRQLCERVPFTPANVDPALKLGMS